METPKDITNLFQKKEIDTDWSFKETKRSERSKWTHGYHRYPAKFIPQIVERLLDDYIRDDAGVIHINDPFLGCGTALVCALSRGYRASGTDINPIAYLITRVKCTPIQPRLLEERVKEFLRRVKVTTSDQRVVTHSNAIEPIIPARHMERIDYWFSTENKDKLGRVLHIIHQEPEDEVRRFLLVAFSHSLKNCSIWLQSSTKPTRDKCKSPSDPYSVLRRHLKRMLHGNESFYSSLSQEVRQHPEEFLNIKIGDARNQPVEDDSVDMIISSSPYITSYEYADLHQLSTIWLDMAEDYRALREGFIGTSYKSGYNGKLVGEIAKYIVSQIAERNKRKAETAEAFFFDMQEVFKENYRTLKEGGRCCYVIGNTVLNGVDVLNAEVFAEGMIRAGFSLDRLIKREMRSKLLPQKRDEKTGRFASNKNADTEAYPVEYIVIGKKENSKM